jgi:Asp-tRNA(Asn)/Glu-tRNA(Gln) amidotransferase A subunit family amidase
MTVIDQLARVPDLDRTVRAFTCVGTSPGASDERPDAIAVAVKDLFDVAGLPTGLGTVAIPARQATSTAAAVTALQNWRAVVVGKTVTSEFAYFGANATRNPWNADFSPGGSSSGSAAAVGAGLVPLAIGTQTNGSIVRPAAYCGVIGFKPTYGTIPTDGLWLYAPSFDTVGVFARTVELAGTAADVMSGGALGFATAVTPPGRAGLRIGVVRTQDWSVTSAEMRSVLDGTAGQLADAGAHVTDMTTPLCGDEGTVAAPHDLGVRGRGRNRAARDRAARSRRREGARDAGPRGHDQRRGIPAGTGAPRNARHRAGPGTVHSGLPAHASRLRHRPTRG